MNPSPIGIFDSGVGGLTVYRALKQALPHENFLYLGDTARVPYGIKTSETIIQYALQASKILVDAGVKFLVIACNTVTGPALPLLQKTYPHLPIIGVIEPGVEMALHRSKTQHIAVIATQSTVAAGSYHQAIKKRAPSAMVLEKAASLLVPLAEEGLVTGEIAEKIVHHYLDELLGLAPEYLPDTLILGCTHFPVLAAVIHEVVGNKMQIIDSAEAVSECVRTYFTDHPVLQNAASHQGSTEFWVTDGKARFMTVAQTFLGHEIDASAVHLVDLC